MAKKKGKKLAVFDIETDPFKYGREPQAFALGFFTGDDYVDFWGENCVERFIDYLAELKTKHVIYAHNGGKFDFYYLLRKGVIENPVKIINGRIVKAKIGIHELRDSFAIIPVALAAYKKDEIDYDLFEAETRDAHRADILHYLAKDCEYTFEMVREFRERFGDNLTIGGTAIKELEKLHPFERGDENHDDIFRPYYFGGRVQCFESGIIHGDFKVFDVNSMYPAVMRNALHPCGLRYTTEYDGRSLTPSGFLRGGKIKRPYFIKFIGENFGALPVRTKEGLDFTVERGEFLTTSHELRAALKLGLVKIDKVLEINAACEFTRFDSYVDKYVAEKIAAKKSGDKVREIFSKLLLNSSYGKFGQNPRTYFDYTITGECDGGLIPQGWELFGDYGDFEIWRKPSEQFRYLDVATAASVTGAARAVLMAAISKATRPIYCDTDSIICENLTGVDIHPSKLGAWDFEAQGDTLAVAGKKMYSLMDKGETVKIASKGVRFEARDIMALCRGVEVEHKNAAPNFKLNGDVKFVQRKIKKLA